MTMMMRTNAQVTEKLTKTKKIRLVTHDTESEEVDPWDKLRKVVINDLNSAWEKQVEENLRQGLLKDYAQAQARSNLLLPVYRKKLRHLYLHYLRWYHNLLSIS